jgi:hypothetical protein
MAMAGHIALIRSLLNPLDLADPTGLTVQSPYLFKGHLPVWGGHRVHLVRVEDVDKL